MMYFTAEEKNTIICAVYGGRPKNERDTCLIGLIDRVDVQRHRLVSSKSKQNTSSFKCYAMKGSSRVEICRKAFISLYSISIKVVQRLTKLRKTNQSPVDMRRKHKNRGVILDPGINGKIHEHILSFPSKQTHYTSTTIIYLEAHLTIKKSMNILLPIIKV